MREALLDLLKQTSPLYTTLVITGTENDTQIAAMNDDKTILFFGKLLNPLPEFNGETALSNLSMLTSLFNFTSYNTDESSFSVKCRPNGEAAELFEFTDGKGAGAVFRLASAKVLPDDKRPPVMSPIPWDLKFSPSKSKVAEFSKLAGIYSEVDKLFSPKTVDKNLVFVIGDESSSTHKASLVFEENVTANFKGNVKFSIQAFLAIMKLTEAHSPTLNITNRGVMMVDITTQYGTYQYVLRATK